MWLLMGLVGLKRCGKSCRLRWLNYLSPTVKRGGFSEEEEDLIIRLHNLLGNRLIPISHLLHLFFVHFPFSFFLSCRDNVGISCLTCSISRLFDSDHAWTFTCTMSTIYEINQNNLNKVKKWSFPKTFWQVLKDLPEDTLHVCKIVSYISLID